MGEAKEIFGNNTVFLSRILCRSVEDARSAGSVSQTPPENPAVREQLGGDEPCAHCKNVF